MDTTEKTQQNDYCEIYFGTEGKLMMLAQGTVPQLSEYIRNCQLTASLAIFTNQKNEKWSVWPDHIIVLHTVPPEELEKYKKMLERFEKNYDAKAIEPTWD